MSEKFIKYLIKHFKKGTTFLILGEQGPITNLFWLNRAGMNCIIIGEDQDYYPFITDNIVIYISDFNPELKVNCYSLHCPIFYQDKNNLINIEDRNIQCVKDII